MPIIRAFLLTGTMTFRFHLPPTARGIPLLRAPLSHHYLSSPVAHLTFTAFERSMQYKATLRITLSSSNVFLNAQTAVDSGC